LGVQSLKPGWKSVKFGDVVKNSNLVERDPASNGIERIVGLEHLDSENLHIRRWNSSEGDTSFTRKFVPGQTLFGKRRAYQRKVAFAEFEGICSGDILTFEPKNTKVLLPELLPFICQSDAFFDYALDTSAGSLSPRTSWTALKDFEFPLPPLAEQKRIAEILWTSDEAKESHYKLLLAQVAFRKAYLRESLSGQIRSHGPDLPQGWEISKIGKACQILNNLRKPISQTVRAKMRGQYPYYGPTGKLDNLNEYRIEGEYVLIGEDGDHFTKFDDWAMTQLVSGRFNVNNHAHILCGTDVCLTRYIFYYFKHRDISPFLSKQGATRLKLNKGTLQTIPILLPPIEEQKKMCQRYAAIDAAIEACRQHLESSKMQIGVLAGALIGGVNV